MGTNEFTTKILPLKNNLFRVVFRITGDVEQSEQIVQEALLKVCLLYTSNVEVGSSTLPGTTPNEGD